ncbi:hypothetical protein M5K25_016116 [Dendrobium thyrsiflorum]|uniref:Pre-mRNA-splicing factor 38 n=1 Tax=Dendrobium thyrsiflorum TaxID=117978 RepID=A0ABD0US45_DENTH
MNSSISALNSPTCGLLISFLCFGTQGPNPVDLPANTQPPTVAIRELLGLPPLLFEFAPSTTSELAWCEGLWSLAADFHPNTEVLLCRCFRQIPPLILRNALGLLLCDRKVPLKLKGKSYKMVFRFAMLYGVEYWPLKEKHNIKLSVAEMRMLRWMTGLTFRDRMRNDHIHEKVGVFPIDDNIREYTRLRESQAAAGEGPSGGSAEISDYHTWSQAVGGVQHGRVYGLGSQAYTHEWQTSGSSSFLPSTQESLYTQQIAALTAKLEQVRKSQADWQMQMQQQQAEMQRQQAEMLEEMRKMREHISSGRSTIADEETDSE